MEQQCSASQPPGDPGQLNNKHHQPEPEEIEAVQRIHTHNAPPEAHLEPIETRPHTACNTRITNTPDTNANEWAVKEVRS
jgi:hypothetical protein